MTLFCYKPSCFLCENDYVHGLVSVGSSMICSDIWHKYHATSDISKLLYVLSRAVRRVKFETILKYHE